MGQTTNQIEADIQETRDSLGSNLGELERRAKSAADWKQQFRANPAKCMSWALGGGFILAALFGRGRGRDESRQAYAQPAPSREPPAYARSDSATTSKMWEGLKVALVGAATTRLARYLKTERPNDRPSSGGYTGKTNGSI